MTLTLVDDGDRGEGEEQRASLFDDPKIVAEVQELVDREAPRLFAVVRETFEPEDVQVAAWGMTTRKGVEVFPVHGGTHMSLQAADNALIFFRAGGRAVPRVVWVGGDGGE